MERTDTRSLGFRLRTDFPYLVVGAIVLSLTAYRAATTGITYDEAETYLRYVEKSGHADKEAPAGLLSVHRANNHPLNTLLIDLTTLFSPYRELAIRLPNLIMCAVYLWLAVVVSGQFRSRPVVFGLLALNYYLDEFFGLGRGYGLSAGLVLAALSVSLDHTEDEGKLRTSLGLLLLASLANYAAVALLAAFLLEAALARGAQALFRSLRSVATLAGALVLGWILYAFAAVTETGKPLVGDVERGFWDPIVGSTLRMLVPEWRPPIWILVLISFVLLGLLAGPAIAGFRTFRFGRCLILLLAMVTAASHILGKPMPTERVLLPYWPLLCLAVGEAVDFHAQRLVRRWPTLVRPSVLAFHAVFAALLLNYARQVDLTSTREWRRDYRRADAVRGPLARGDCVRPWDLKKHPVVDFYVKRAGKTLDDPSLMCSE